MRMKPTKQTHVHEYLGAYKIQTMPNHDGQPFWILRSRCSCTKYRAFFMSKDELEVDKLVEKIRVDKALKKKALDNAYA